MSVILGALVLAFVAFASLHYTLGVFTAKEPLKAILAAVFAVLCVVFGIAFWGSRL